jgi:hypothetical protein
MHQKCLHFIHKLYIHSDSTSIFLQHKTTDLIVPEVLVPLLHPLFFCSMNLGYLSDAAENQRHSQKALNYRFLLQSILLSLFLPKLSPKLQLYPPFSKLQLSQLSDVHLCYLLSPHTAEIVLLKTAFWSFSFRRPLLLPEASPNLSVPFQSDSQSAVLPSSSNRLHQCWPPYPFLHTVQKKTMQFHATMMERRHTESVNTIMPKTLG